MLKNRKKKGFTLIELIVVIAILGILAAIAIPRFANVTRNSERSAVEANLRTIDGAIQIAIAGESAANIDTVAKMEALLKSTYVQSWPTKPGTYTLVGTDGNVGTYRASVTGEVGGKTFTNQTLTTTMWD